MKKTYINPNIKVVAIKYSRMLASSLLDTSGETPIQEDFSCETDDTSGNLGRSGFFSDDE